MKDVALLAGGVVLGLAVANVFLPAESSCCARVSANVRYKAMKAAGPFGGLVGAIGDFIGWRHTPGWLDAAGVPVDA